MKKIKIFAIGLLLILFSLPAVAQMKIGIKAGANMNNVRQNFKESSAEINTRILFAYHAGVLMDYSISDKISLQPGLFYSRKGFSLDWESELQGEESFEGFDRTYFDYIELPVHLAYKFRNIQLYAGPYVSSGIGGKNKMDFSYEMQGNKVDLKDDFQMRPFLKKEVKESDLKDDESPYYGLDYGINVGVGFTRGQFMINTGYSNGFGNLVTNTSDFPNDRKDNKLNNTGFNISLTYFFRE